MSKPWLVVQDRSGWHKALHADNYLEDQHDLAGEADTYLEACKIADELNMIAEVQDG